MKIIVCKTYFACYVFINNYNCYKQLYLSWDLLYLLTNVLNFVKDLRVTKIVKEIKFEEPGSN